MIEGMELGVKGQRDDRGDGAEGWGDRDDIGNGPGGQRDDRGDGGMI